MKTPLIATLTLVALSLVTGCVSVHKEAPEATTTTTRQTTIGTPAATTTVERTTVY